MQNGNMTEAMEELAEGVVRFFNTLLANDFPVDVAANLTVKLIESMLLSSGRQYGGD